MQLHRVYSLYALSLDDRLVMQLHPGVHRNHNPRLFTDYGRDKGADIPLPGEFVDSLKPLLDRVGNEPGFTLILFTLDETTYSRELAPLAGLGITATDRANARTPDSGVPTARRQATPCLRRPDLNPAA